MKTRTLILLGLLIVAIAVGISLIRPVHAPEIPRPDPAPVETGIESASDPPLFSEQAIPARTAPVETEHTDPISPVEQASLSGIVVDHQDHPLENVIVEAHAGGRIFGRVDSDATGRFAFPKLRAGTYTLVSDTSRFTNASLEGVRAGTSGVVLRLAPTATIVGRIMDSDSGAAIGKFEAVVLDEVPERMMKLRAAKWRAFDTGDGAMEFTGVQARAHCILAVRAQGYTPKIERVPPIFPGARSYPVTIALTRGASLEGRITDPKGSPIEGAILYDRDWVGERFSLGLSDSAGNFLAAGLEAGTLNLTVRHRDYAPTTAIIALRPGILERRDFTLKTGGRIAGRVLRGNKGVPNLVVHVFNQSNPRERFRAATDAHGNYTAKSLPAGDFIVMLLADENAKAIRTDMKKFAHVEEDRVTEIDFVFAEAGASIEGTVLMFGEPPEQARVMVDVMAASGLVKFQSEVGANGDYLLDNLPAGAVTITAIARYGEDAHRNITISFDIEHGEAVIQDFNFADAASVQGVVSGLRKGEAGHVVFLVGDERGAVPDPEELERLSGLAAAQVRTDADGAYRVMNLEPGTYTAVAAGVRGEPATIAELLEETRYSATLIEIGEGEMLRLDFTL